MLPVDVAMGQYETLRAQLRVEASGSQGRAGAIHQALMAMWEEYTAPYRVVRLEKYGQEVYPHYVVYRVEGHGHEWEVWHLRGEHRERDAVRMSVMLRNEKLLAQQDALEQGGLDWALRHCQENVLDLKGEKPAGQSQAINQPDPSSHSTPANEWQQASPFTEEFQTLEYVLEFGGEGGRAAIMRTHLRGRPRYWTLRNHITWDEDDEPVVTGTSLEFLGTEADAALRGCPYPWAKLVGLALAPDLVPLVQVILVEQGRTLDDWLQYFERDDGQKWSCRYAWWGCTTFTDEPLDAYWLTARPEVVRRTLGGLSHAQVVGLMANPAESVGVLVDRRGRVLITEASSYPFSQMWSTSPFSEVPEFQVQTLSELWLAAPSRPGE